MAKMTLLDMTQNILSALDSDSVNSIDDTVESVQVAEIIKETFFDIISQREWSFLFQLGTLTAYSDTSNPTKMKIPDTWNKIKWIKYNKKEIEYLTPHDFTDLLHSRTVVTGITNSAGYGINKDPSYWTSYNDTDIIFDSINLTVESTLQASKTVVYGVVAPTWTHVDNFIPNIPEKFFPTLLADAKSQAFVNLKQQANNREERKAQRGRMTMRNEAWRNEYGEVRYNTKVHYGRK